jgi:putative ABC transport system permease protein
VVGIVRAVRLGGPESPLRPEVYTPFSFERAFGGTMFLRTARDPDTLSGPARLAVQAVLTDVVVPETQTFDAMYDRLVVQRKFNMIVLALFGGLAVTIAAAGVYGVMAYTVQQRAQEIGVRMALGAQRGQVLRMVLSRASVLMVAGVVIGLAAGWALARFITTFLFQVEPHDVIVYVTASVLLLLTGLAAALVPARRASKVDPMSVLR